MWYHKTVNGFIGEGLPMRELIKKTVSITLAAVAGAILLGVAACMLFFPSAVSEAAYGMGMYKISASFAKSAYGRSGDFGDLKVLVERSILAEKHAYVVKYAPEFIGNEKFSATSQAEDSALKDGWRGSYFYFITGNFAVSLYVTENTSAALETAVLYTQSYEKYNSTEYLLKAVIDADDREFGKELLSEMKKYVFEGEEAELLLRDINILESFIG